MTARLDARATEAIHPTGPFGFIDVAIALVRHRVGAIACVLLGMAAGLAAAYLVPVSYVATARILPPQQPQGGAAAALIGQLGSLGAGLGGGLGVKNPADLYVGMLKSRTITDALIAKFDLKARYEAETMFDARLQLDRRSTFVAGKDGIITIDSEDADAAFAAELANAFVSELAAMTDSLALNESSQRRTFFERQVREARDALAIAESGMRSTQERTGLIRLEEQGQVVIQAVAALKAQVVAKEVQIEAMRTFASDGNPELARTRRELASLREQLKRLERDGGGDSALLVPTAKVPELGVDYLRALRELKYREAVFEVMVKQFEMARLEEARNAAIVQVIDRAVPPDRRAKPQRTLLVIAGVLAGMLLGVVFAVACELLDRDAADPTRGGRLALLKRHLAGT